MKKIIIVSLLHICILLCIKANTAYTGMRDISSTELVKDMQVGWNLACTLDAYGDWVSGLDTETCWGNPKTTKAMIDEIAKMGFKTLRIPVTWRGHISNTPEFVIDSVWLNRVEEIANYGFQNDMYVIINIHHDDPWIKLNHTDMNTVKYKLDKLWTQIADRFIEYGDYLVFETLNEPRTEGSAFEWLGGTSEERSILNQYHKTCVDAIRATGRNNSTRKIMISTYAASTYQQAMDDLVLPDADTNIIVSLHSYFPFFFCLGGMDKTWGTNSDKKSLDDELDRIYNKFIVNGIPVVLGEWGSMDNDNYADRILHADYFTKACKKREITPIWYNADTTKRLLNRNTLEWASPELIEVLIQGISPQDCAQTELIPCYQIESESEKQSAYISSINEGSVLKLNLRHEGTEIVKWVNQSGDTIAGNELIFNPIKLQDTGLYKGFLINKEGCKSWEFFNVNVD